MKQNDEYFAAADSANVCTLLQERVDDWIRIFQMTAQYKRMRKSWAMYYGLTTIGGVNSAEITQAGPRGEYSMIMMNHYRNFLQHIHVLTTAQRPALECQATNSDSESQEQTQLGDALLEYYMRDKKVERYLRNAAEYALFLSEGFIGMEWEPTQGNMFTVQNGTPIYEGDMEFTNYTPLDVVRDVWRNDQKMPWVITIKWKNRWNLMAKYPDMADKIKAVNPEELWRYREDFFNRVWWMQNDLIPEFTFQHERCEALPQGRVVKFLSTDVLLLDAPLPTEKVPVFRISASDQADTIYGYTPGFDLLGAQEALNLVDSSLLTSIKTFGVGCIKLPEGHNIQYEQIAEGLSALVINEKFGKAEAMNFLEIPNAMPAFRASILTDMERISAVNSVVRGQPDASISSGSFAALVAAQAIQFNSGFQMSYSQLTEDTGSTIIEMLQKFASTKRVAKIVGKNSQYMLKSFSGQDLGNIKGVLVQQANPLTQTNAGRMNMADSFLQKGLIHRPEQYQQVLETGKLEPIFENERTALNNIKRENEMLRDGKIPIAVLTEDHKLHIEEHSAVLDNPESKLDDQVRAAVLNHIFEHIQVWGQVPPQLSQALGRQPLIQPMPPMGMPPIGGGPQPEGPQGPQQGPGAPAHMGPKAPAPGQMMDARPGPVKHMPQPPQKGPVNPQTGQATQLPPQVMSAHP